MLAAVLDKSRAFKETRALKPPSLGNAVKHFLMRKTGFCVAKVVKTFGFIAYTAETLDEFRYKMLHSVAPLGRVGLSARGG